MFEPRWRRCLRLLKRDVVFAIAASVLPIGVPHDAQAQGRGGVPLDSASTVNSLYPRLFDGLKLSSAQETKAKALIWKTMQAQERAAAEIGGPEGYEKVRALQATRDSAITMLFTSAEERAQFERNAAKMRPQPVQRP